MEFPKLRDWSSKKILYCISKNWSDRVKIQNDLNAETMQHVKAKDFEEREEMNPDNTFTINDKLENSEVLNEMINEDQQSELDWSKIAPLM